MAYRLIASDLDGTLLNDAKTLSPRTEAALKAATDRGVYFVPATGRSLVGVPEWIKESPYVQYIMTANGARVVDVKNNSTLFVEPLDHEVALRLMDILLPYGAMWNLYANATVYSEYHGPLAEKDPPPDLKGNRRLPPPLKPDMKTYLMEHPEMEVEKMDIYFDTPEERQLAWEIVEKWEGISLAAAFSFNMEVNSALGDKGHGLHRLGRELGISPDEIMAFGDGLNDVKLLTAAGLPVAVSNAVPALKAVAKEITLSNEEDGVAVSIEKHILNV